VLEWYDFAVFGYFSDVLGTVSFPPDQPGNMALMESFAVFLSCSLSKASFTPYCKKSFEKQQLCCLCVTKSFQYHSIFVGFDLNGMVR
jgi:hypothetical protein